ncbi:class I SAM-dependent methyltransferase [Patescibacteria group bacterium]|nr:class I SAM-dependent methyltransferase [Patescibacteria group bacterium]
MDLSSLATYLSHFTVLEVTIYLLILIPTVYTMVGGAPFVPTQMRQVHRMLDAVPLKKGMKLYDLGSGDGRLVHTASKKYNVEAVGYEYSPLIWLWGKMISPFWRSKAKLKFGNFYRQNLSDADIIVCYLLPGPMKRMRKEIYPRLKKGAIIISHAFHIPELDPLKILPKDKDLKLSPVWIYEKK